MTGFAHPDFARSFEEFGVPRKLVNCGGWLVERSIPGFPETDAMGCYPLFACRDWSQLGRDLDELPDDLVCIFLVTDPFGQYDEQLLNRNFDLVMPFKKHFVADLRQPATTIVSAHHRKYARRSLRNITVDISDQPLSHFEEWMTLFDNLANRFKVTGMRAFSRSAFQKQLSIPGAYLFRALHNGEAIAAHLWYSVGNVCYGYLVGDTPDGHEQLAAYGLYWSAIEFFSNKVSYLDWGGVAGLADNENDGLVKFKRGWSTETRMSYFCGRILDRQKYNYLVEASGVGNTSYFPAYRLGEFG